MFFPRLVLITLTFLIAIYALIVLVWHDNQDITPIILVSYESRFNIILVENKVGKQNFSLREICAIESAAFHHPDASVTLYNVNGKTDESDENVKNLISHYSNIYFQSINISDIFMETPLERWSVENRILQSEYPVEHMSDALRLVLLWRHGGLYMDTDAIIMKPFYEFENAIDTEGYNWVVGGVMIFQKHSSFIYKAMQQYVLAYDGSIYNNQGPKLLTNQLKIVCNVRSFKAVINKPELCQGIRILPENMFYPVPWTKVNTLFDNSVNYSVALSQAYSVHLYGHAYRTTLIKTGEGSAVETLFQEHCNHTYQLMLKNKYL